MGISKGLKEGRVQGRVRSAWERWDVNEYVSAGNKGGKEWVRL
jgi:hypothetical protein